MMVAGYEISLAYILVAGGLILLGSAFKFYKLPVSKPLALVLGIGLVFIGGWQAGWIDTGNGGGDSGDTGGTGGIGELSEGLNMECWLKDYEAKTAIASKTVGLYEAGTQLIEIQSAKVQPLVTATTDSNGKAVFYGLAAGDYVIGYYNDETAFDGTHYAAAAKPVSVRKVSVLESDETVSASPDPNLYVKMLGDVFYTITATSGSNSSSGGVDADATITESGSSGTTVHVTISSNTNKAWLTDEAYYQRVYLTTTWTNNDGSTNTEVTLASCKLNSSSGQNISKDSSASYYVDVSSPVMKNTDTAKNLTFSFTIWVPDIGEVTTTADTLAVTFKHTLIRKDATNQTILQDTGHKITITCADNS